MLNRAFKTRLRLFAAYNKRVSTLIQVAGFFEINV